MSAIAAGFGSAVYIAPMALAHTKITDQDIRGGIIFVIGLLGTHVFATLTTYGPDIIRKIMYRWTGVTPDKPDSEGTP